MKPVIKPNHDFKLVEYIGALLFDKHRCEIRAEDVRCSALPVQVVLSMVGTRGNSLLDAVLRPAVKGIF